jgi:hypothetical protein
MRYLLSLFFILTLAPCCFSQSPGFRYGFHAGAGQAKIEGAELLNQLGKLAINAGFISAYQINKNVGLVAEVLLTYKGARTEGSIKSCCIDYKYEEIYRLNYVEVPVMVKGSIGISSLFMKVFTGPSVNFNIKSSRSRTFENDNFNMIYGYSNNKMTGIKLMELAWVAGAGFEVELEEKDIVFLEIRNNMALTSFGNINGKSGFNNYLGLVIGYLY